MDGNTTVVDAISEVTLNDMASIVIGISIGMLAGLIIVGTIFFVLNKYYSDKI